MSYRLRYEVTYLIGSTNEAGSTDIRYHHSEDKDALLDFWQKFKANTPDAFRLHCVLEKMQADEVYSETLTNKD